jgi:low temperature requirement protein LtrA
VRAMRCSPSATSRCRSAGTWPPRRCWLAATASAACSSGWWCGAPHRTRYGWPGHTATNTYDIEGGHFAERCQGFIIIALGESVVVTGATAAAAGLTPGVVLCLVIAFVETAALWWLYFGAAAERTRAVLSASDDPGRLARDAYTYLQLPIVAGIVAVAVGQHLLIAEPDRPLHGVGLAVVLGGPALYLLGECLFRWRVTSAANLGRVAVAATLVVLVPIGDELGALTLTAVVAALLSLLAVWELHPATAWRAARPASS